MVAMVTIETPGFKPKQWLTLDKNFLVPSTCSTKVYTAPFCAKVTMSIIHRRQAHAIQMNCSNLKGFRATIQIQVDSEDKQTK